MLQEELRAMLYQALSEPLGLVLEVNDFQQATQAFYRARAGDPALARLVFRRSPNPSELWIVNPDGTGHRAPTYDRRPSDGTGPEHSEGPIPEEGG